MWVCTDRSPVARRLRLAVAGIAMVVLQIGAVTPFALGASAVSVQPVPRDSSSAAATPAKPAPPVFQPGDRAVSTWRLEAARNLILTPDQVASFLGPALAPRVARCVKLNNYWCIKKAGWKGEIAADSEGHVAFASAVEGAAVAALLLKRYYVDFNRHTAAAIISHWAPAQCGSDSVSLAGIKRLTAKTLAPKGLGNTLRARWLAGHARGFASPVAGRKAPVRRSIVANHLSHMMPAPTIAAGLGETRRSTRPMTLDALLMSSPNAPPSRSMLGMPKGRSGLMRLGSVSSCGSDGPRIAAYAAKAAAGIKASPDGDLALFANDGTPTANLSLMMINMARVEIGPFGATQALIDDGIAEAFKPDRNPGKS